MYLEHAVNGLLEYLKLFVGKPTTKQVWNHCGPKCLEEAARFFGETKYTQRDFARFANAPLSVFFEGVDEIQLKKAASKVFSERKSIYSEQFAPFKRETMKKLKDGYVIMVSCMDGLHWALIKPCKRSKNKVRYYDPLEGETLVTWDVLKVELENNDPKENKYIGICLEKKLCLI